MKKAAAICSAMVLMASAMGSLSVGAKWHVQKTTSIAQNKSFTRAWHKTITMDFPALANVAEVTVTIGYDTWWTNEDYVNDCYAPTGWPHLAVVQNSIGNKAATAQTKGGYITGKADINHIGEPVTYFVYLET